MIATLIGIMVAVFGGLRLVWRLLMRGVEKKVAPLIQRKLAESAKEFRELIVPRMEEVKRDLRRQIDDLRTEINDKLETALETEKRLERLESGKR